MMEWPTAAVVISVVLAIASVVRAAIHAAAEARVDEVAGELDQIWNAIDITIRDVERITPIEMSLSDQ